jgi:hypothetical protein
MNNPFSAEQRLIFEHIVSTVLIEIGLAAVSGLGWLAFADETMRSRFIAADEWAMFSVFLWLLRNLAVTLWNNREKLKWKSNAVFA